MQVINDQYKIIRTIRHDQYGSTLAIEDLYKGNALKYLRLIHLQQETQEFIEYMKDCYYDYSDYGHPNIASFHFFNRVKLIDNKPSARDQYYYTYDYFEGPSLFETSKEQSFMQQLDMLVQLCAAAQYLHCRGFVIGCISEAELITVDITGKKILKVMSLPYPQNADLSICINEYPDVFMAPEIRMGQSYSILSDIFLIGMVGRHIFSDTAPEAIGQIMQKCISESPAERYQSVEQLIAEINFYFETEFNIIDKKYYQTMPHYRVRPVGRLQQIKNILNNVKEYHFAYGRERATIAVCPQGTGKSDFVNALGFRGDHDGFNIIDMTLNENDNPIQTLQKFMKSIIKYADKDIKEKYLQIAGLNLSELMEEQHASSDLSSEQHREFDMLEYKVIGFISEACSKTSYLWVIDNFQWLDAVMLSVLRGVLVDTKGPKLYAVLATSVEDLTAYQGVNRLVLELEEKKLSEKVTLGSFNFAETAEYLRLMLGMAEAPSDFSEKVYKHTDGHPEHIYSIIHMLFYNGDIFIDQKGHWDFSRVKCDTFRLPQNTDEKTILELSRINPGYDALLKALSIFNSPISPDVISRIVSIEGEELISLLNYLSYINILIRREDDWGVSFYFCHADVKRSLYTGITVPERTRMHMLAAAILEEKFERENRENREELISQMVSAGLREKATRYMRQEAEKKLAGNLIAQALQLLEQAYCLIRDSHCYDLTIEICNKAAEVYGQLGEYAKALSFYDHMMRMAEQTANEKLKVDVHIKRAVILYALDDKKGFITHAVKAKKLLREVSYPEGVYELILCFNEIMMLKRKYNTYIRILERGMLHMDKEVHADYYARFLGVYGKFKAYKNKYEESLDALQRSIAILEDSGKYEELPYSLNSAGFVYTNYLNDLQKAREYYEKCLSISLRTNKLYFVEVSYNNLADLYRLEDRNADALQYLKKALEVAGVTKSRYVQYLIRLNMMLCRFAAERYNEAYINMKEIEDSLRLERDMGDAEEFLCQCKAELYYAIGDFERAEAYAQKSVDMCISWGIPENLESLTVKRLSEIEREGSLDFAKDSELCRRIFGDNLYKLGRGLCVKLAEIYAGKGEKVEEARLFLEQGRRYADKIDTEILRLRYDYVETLLAEGEDHHNKLFRLAGRAENVENNEIHWKIYKAVAMALVDQGDYREALRYLISALNDLRKLVYSVPDEYKVRFIESHGRNTVKESLERVSGLLTGHMEAETESVSLYSMDKYFDYTAYRELYRRKDEERGAVINISAHNKFLGKIQELLGKFTEDDGENLKQLIQLYAETTQAKNAFIATLSEDGSLNILASYNRYNENPFYEYMIEQVKQKKDSILVTDTFEYSRKKGEILIPKEITAVFCIPITVPKESEGVGYVEEKRRYREQGSNPAIGYIYADTDSIINNFTEESSGFCILASRMAYVLVDNYNLKMVSMVDKLTKLYTRKYFEAALQNELAYAEKEDGAFSIVMIDIDKFKTVNDRYGHQKGDEILQNVSSIIMNTVRKGDVCGRYGGEEIILLLPSTKREDALQVAEKLRKKIENAKLLGLNNPLTVSLGIATYPEHGTWAKDLIDKADQAMYHVKESGRNGSRVYEANMSKHTRRIDKLAGIISGDLVEDQRKVETLLEILELTRQEGKSVKEKLFCFLGRVIEVSEAQTGILFKVEETEEGKARIGEQIARKKLVENAVKEVYCNMDIIERCMESRSGEYLLDWSGYPGIDAVTGMPDWQSVIAVPLTLQGKLQGIIYLSVSIKNREFDANTYNYIKTLCDIVSAVYKKSVEAIL